MRTSDRFIEVTGFGGTNGKKFLVNKSAIIFVTQEDGTDKARISIANANGDRMYRIVTKESYKEVANNLLNWVDFKFDPCFAEPGVCAPEKEDKDD